MRLNFTYSRQKMVCFQNRSALQKYVLSSKFKAILFENKRFGLKHMQLRDTSCLKLNNFRWNYVKLRHTPILKTDKNRQCSTKLCQIEAHYFLEIESINHFRRNHVKMRRTPFLKISNFRRKQVKLRRTIFWEMDENGQLSTKIGRMRAALRAGLSGGSPWVEKTRHHIHCKALEEIYTIRLHAVLQPSIISLTKFCRADCFFPENFPKFWHY